MANDPVKTLRDEFAMAALSGLMAGDWESNTAVPFAFRIADAMMRARQL